MIQAERSPRFAAHEQLDESERQPCEIWTRVMGYHRPVASFNRGKQGEFYERCYFHESQPGSQTDSQPQLQSRAQ